MKDDVRYGHDDVGIFVVIRTDVGSSRGWSVFASAEEFLKVFPYEVLGSRETHEKVVGYLRTGSQWQF